MYGVSRLFEYITRHCRIRQNSKWRLSCELLDKDGVASCEDGCQPVAVIIRHNVQSVAMQAPMQHLLNTNLLPTLIKHDAAVGATAIVGGGDCFDLAPVNILLIMLRSPARLSARGGQHTRLNCGIIQPWYVFQAILAADGHGPVSQSSAANAHIAVRGIQNELIAS